MTLTVVLAVSLATPPARGAPPDEATTMEQAAMALYGAGLAHDAIAPAQAAVRLRLADPATAPGALAALYAILGEIQRDAGLLDDARRSLEEGLRLAGDGAVEARLRHALGAVHESAGRAAEADAQYASAAALYESPDAQALDGPRAVSLAGVLRDRGALAAAQARLDAAQGYLTRAINLLDAQPATSLAARSLQAAALQDQGDLAMRRGASDAAGALYQRALEIRRGLPRPHPLDLASSLQRLAAWNEAAGRYSQAHRLLPEALALTIKARGENHVDVATVEGRYAELLRKSGDLPAAQLWAERSLQLRTRLLPPGHPDIARSSSGLGLVLQESGDNVGARARLDEALAIWDTQPGLKAERAASLDNRGAVLHALGLDADSARDYAESNALWREVYGPGHPYAASTLNQWAEVEDALGHTERARSMFAQAVSSLMARDDAPMELAMALSRMADFQARHASPELAIFLGKQSVNGLQKMRADVARVGQGAQQGFVNARHDVYQRLAARLVDAGRLGEAQQVMRMLKDDEFFEYVRGEDSAGSAGAAAALNPDEATAAKQFDAVATEQSAAARELRTLEAASDGAPPKPEMRARMRELRETLRRGVDAFQAYVAAIGNRLSRGEPGAGNALTLGEIETMQGSLGDAGHGAVLLHYMLLDDQLRIILTTPKAVLSRSVAVKRSAINQAIATMREQIVRRDPAVRATARQLYGWLVAPVADDLADADAHTLMISPVGALRYLPFAALYDGRSWLVERYALSTYTPSAAMTAFRAPAAQWRVAAFGTTRQYEGFAPLPSVRGELAGIVGDQGLPGLALLDDQFTRDSMEDAAADQPSVIHLASHFVFKPGDESDSFLLLGDGRHMSLVDMKSVSFRKLDLLTLSACETAIGGSGNGREVEGFAALAQKRGAAAVLATLWSVADQSTAQLMQRFYRHRRRPGTTKADALRDAQLQFIREGSSAPSASDALAAPDATGSAEVVATTVSTQRGARRADTAAAANGAVPGPASPGMSHPFYWAPFVLMGNWL